MSLPTAPVELCLRQLFEGLRVEPMRPLLHALLAWCDGTRTVPALVDAVAADFSEVSVEDVVALLEELLEEGTVDSVEVERV